MTDVTAASSLIDRATADLTSAGIDTPRLDARLLMAWVLRCRREDLAREPERPVSERDALVFNKAVSLRVLRRPLPYLTGEQIFYGRAFKINRAVLIPRPETEILVTAALEKIRDIPNPTIVDIGTGSGCIAVTLACERPDARVWATDLCPLALKLARKNVVRHALEDRVTLLEGDLLQPLPPDLLSDVIVSNPPYIAEHELPNLQPEVRDYEPRLALAGVMEATGPNGTGLYDRIFTEAARYLKPGGWVLVEVGQGQAEAVMEIARVAGCQDVSVVYDYSGIARVVRTRG